MYVGLEAVGVDAYRTAEQALAGFLAGDYFEYTDASWCTHTVTRREVEAAGCRAVIFVLPLCRKGAVAFSEGDTWVLGK
jgi:hypothetical protein